ncbi:MAG: family metallopeptidase, partial [Acidobacteria bacterium]|nr:family metallopeptidase [Acidobacteriota bacterium]
RALFTPLNGRGLMMPVVGVRPGDLDDSWHAPRDGGVRQHTGIDIFAPRGTAVVAVADGIITYIGDQPKGGHCFWLTTENGSSFYYAHLDRWAPGMYEGMEVQTGDLLGFVGNTGNAIHTPSHLHFAINQNDEMVNPYPLLRGATIVRQARNHVQLGGGTFGTK